MSTKTTLEIKSFSTEETQAFGRKLGKLLNGGEIIELTSDLGGGKTTLTKGIVEGLGSSDHVSSPTFKICNNYKADNDIKIYHYDFYRISDPQLITYELDEVIGDKQAIIIIEWANVIKSVLPEDVIEVDLKTQADDSRNILVKYYDKLNMMKKLTE